jgi:hypothetical protein
MTVADAQRIWHTLPYYENAVLTAVAEKHLDCPETLTLFAERSGVGRKSSVTLRTYRVLRMETATEESVKTALQDIGEELVIATMRAANIGPRF